MSAAAKCEIIPISRFPINERKPYIRDLEMVRIQQSQNEYKNESCLGVPFTVEGNTLNVFVNIDINS